MHLGPCAALIQADADTPRVDCTQVEARSAGALHDRLLLRSGVDTQRIEEMRVQRRVAAGLQSTRQHLGEAMDAPGNGPECVRAMIDRVERGHQREQRLCGADIARRFLAPDMLLAGLHRHAIGLVAACIDRDSDDAPGERALVFVAGSEIRRMRTAKTHRHAKALGIADRDIGTHLARTAQ